MFFNSLIHYKYIDLIAMNLAGTFCATFEDFVEKFSLIESVAFGEKFHQDLFSVF